ncbi:DUF2236 domain-containing protein [Oleomonas cavernae]|uniref:DUF2236 domain-containing protein n=1 Tax=Oleomonas cavernae TaxID=2320859 RepID=A0A418WFQ9_9PROT|nr:oxygenase MpaB family protein [Oleomonas cavernae]RJF88822.1 DUF2236 domain-containing protein [Oleomonas cavernae]
MTGEIQAARIPSRHGVRAAEARVATARLKLVIRRDPEPTPDEWRRIGEALDRSDPVADALVDWMAEMGMGPARALFEQALEHGIETVPDAPAPLRDFFRVVDARPDWLDNGLLARGATACQLCGNTGSQVLRDGALMGGYQASGLNRVLVMTGALEKGAGKRIAETSTWWMACTATGGMARFGVGFKLTLRVRLVHAIVRRHVGNRPDWNRARDGVPINQMDMAATQLAFSALFLIGVRTLGTLLSREDGLGVMHLMRYSGWLMGIEEAFLPQDEQSGRALLYQMALSLTDPDEAGRSLARALLDEPLSRPYRFLPSLRRHYERERNLSINRFFLGGRAMRALGLPWRPIPWYPLLAAPLNALRFLVGNRSLSARLRTAEAGRIRQQAWIDSLVGRADHKIGGAVTHITEHA